METLTVKNITHADEVRELPKTKIELLTVGDGTIMRATFQPGWRWSECVKPTAGTDSCEVAHACFVISGKIHIIMDDGTEKDLGPGDFASIAPGHDAYVVGNEPAITLDFSGNTNYGKKQ